MITLKNQEKPQTYICFAVFLGAIDPAFGPTRFCWEKSGNSDFQTCPTHNIEKKVIHVPTKNHNIRWNSQPMFERSLEIL